MHDDVYVDRGQHESDIASLKADIKILTNEVNRITKTLKENEDEHKNFFKSVIRALLGIIGAIATGFSALVLEGRF